MEGYMMAMQGNYGYFVIMIIIAVLGWVVQWNLKRKFEKYSQEYIPYTGAQVAQKMLDSYGLKDVRITHVAGNLTDHYNPTDKTLNLSDAVYATNSIAAAAVAAHECGHAVQHATAYSWLTLRSKLVPAVQFSSNLVPWVLIGGIALLEIFPKLLLIGIILFAVTTLFSVVTLPVEIDASRRALAWLDKSGMTSFQTQKDAKEALKAAAYTYVVAALSSLLTLFYYISIYMGRRD
jgi:hypothetical protein